MKNCSTMSIQWAYPVLIFLIQSSVQVVHKALIQSGKQIPLSFLKIGIKGDVLDEMNLYVESSTN